MNDYAYFIMHYKKNIERRNYIFENFVTNDKTIYWITDFDREEIADYLDEIYCFNHDYWYQIVGSQLHILIGHLVGLNPNQGKTAWQPLMNRIQELIKQNGLMKVIQKFPQYMPRSLKLHEISILLKHRAAYQKIIDHNYRFGIILEDDFILKDTSSAALQKLIGNSMIDWDFIDLAGGAKLTPRKLDNELFPGVFAMQPPSTRTACGYMISNRLCKEIVNLNLPPVAPCDWELTYYMLRFSAKAFWSEPPIFIHGSETDQYKTNNE